MLARFVSRALRTHPRPTREWVQWAQAHPPLAEGICRVTEAGWSYLEREALRQLADAALVAEQHSIPGAVVEVGCGRGGSAVVLALAKAQGRPLHLYDTFRGLPPSPGSGDGADAHLRYQIIRRGFARGLAGEPYYGYLPDRRGSVEELFRQLQVPLEEHAVTFVEGRAEDTLAPNGPVALAHIDCDWYAPVRVSLERLAPRLSVGGRIILDDAGSWSGCRRALRAFRRSAPAGQYGLEQHARVHLVRLEG